MTNIRFFRFSFKRGKIVSLSNFAKITFASISQSCNELRIWRINIFIWLIARHLFSFSKEWSKPYFIQSVKLKTEEVKLYLLWNHAWESCTVEQAKPLLQDLLPAFFLLFLFGRRIRVLEIRRYPWPMMTNSFYSLETKFVAYGITW